MDIDKLLKNRHTAQLEWGESWPALGPEGNSLDANITSRATVHDCVNVARHAAHIAGETDLSGNDDIFLQAFIDAHWAVEVKS